MAGLAIGLLCCKSEPPEGARPGAAPRPAAATRSAPAAPPSDLPSAKPASDKLASDKPDRAARTHRAARCGECHEKMYREWRASPHARAGQSELYRALRETSDASCERCHEPLHTLGAGAELARVEGVNCDVCHRMDRVTVRAGHADAPLQATGKTKYGPRCDVRSPYFHKAECRPIFVKSEFCAACHLLSVPGANAELLPVHSEYADWLKSPYAARGQTCQSCHMLPGVEAELAAGEPERDGVPDHGFWGRDAALRGSGLKARAEASWHADVLVVEVKIENAGAGHYLPAGAPGRQIVLRVTALGVDGEAISSGERVFERRLLDSNRGVASPTRASGVASDTRIGPLQTRRERFELSSPAASSVSVVLFRRVDPELLQRLQVSSDRELPISSVTLQLRSGDGARRVDSRPSALAP